MFLVWGTSFVRGWDFFVFVKSNTRYVSFLCGRVKSFAQQWHKQSKLCGWCFCPRCAGRHYTCPVHYHCNDGNRGENHVLANSSCHLSWRRLRFRCEISYQNCRISKRKTEFAWRFKLHFPFLTLVSYTSLFLFRNQLPQFPLFLARFYPRSLLLFYLFIFFLVEIVIFPCKRCIDITIVFQLFSSISRCCK